MIQLNPPHDQDYEEVDAFSLEAALKVQHQLPLYIKESEKALIEAKTTLSQAQAIYDKRYNEVFLAAEARTANDKKAIAELAVAKEIFVWEDDGTGSKKPCTYHELVEQAQHAYSMALVWHHYQQNRFDEVKMRVSSLKEAMKRI